MVQANPDTTVDDRAAEPLIVGYDDLELLGTDDVDCFVLNLNEHVGAPPFFVEVDNRRFALQRETFLVRGHGATMPRWILEEEAAGRLVLLAERDTRYLVYVYDAEAGDEDDADGGDD